MKKYKQLFKQLERDILGEKYQLGDFLPSEHQLMEIYQVSRDTVRKALALLQEEGLIEKVRGQGSKVVKQEQLDFPVSNLTSYQELVAQHQLQSKTNVISLDKITVDKKLSKTTGFPEYRLVWRIVRQRVVDSIASVLDIDYLDKSLVPDLTREIGEHSIYSYLEETLKLNIAYARKEITIDHVSDQDQILLDIGRDQHVVSIRSQVYLADGRQFQYTESRHKLDKFRFVDFSTRQKE
ncbi:Trehalose operon transcriptional repressor [Streptococcus cristatus]|uniref:Trehalose operon repressor n=1 Tax=Streptococcus cristatus TaxID=45634 RepID=A0A428GUP2_STRCR|nr:trehalose operon repressor [Streptococcus cristatus]RSJ79209.1 Trehalose operon transcriptional repressor [Streptococcus cristatus]RSJ80281.1 Trehalose operon transcriptional repressor [Streptococcus cristatus]RSJ85339.1 Trehalose operon transcriptional repressor [Streptococcus cristatus]RSJ86062.1 Trehalose operon transcriptional repressor [Streptococcus cristatus]